MGYPVVICTAVLFFNLFSCGSSHDKRTDKTAADTVSQDTASRADTLSIPLSDPAPAPGMVQIRAHIVATDSAGPGSEVRYRLRVLNILAVGSGSPPIVKNDTLQVQSSGSLPAAMEHTDITCTIKHRQVLAPRGETPPRWHLIQCHPNNDSE